MIQDSINAAFEFFAGAFVLLNIIKLHHDKCVQGVSVIAVTFFTIWGCWNLYYYAHLSQFASWAAGISVVTANTVWVAQMIYYRKF